MKLNHQIATFLGIAAVFLPFSSAFAALPDAETYNFVTSRYFLLLDERRSGCGFFANPDTLAVDDENRSLLVLQMRSPNGGSACNGVFDFHTLQVRCESQEVSYSSQIGSPATWDESWMVSPTVAEQVCALSSQ